jgi:hypothetical protein
MLNSRIASCCLFFGTVAALPAAASSYYVQSPIVTQGEVEIETRSFITSDNNDAKNKERNLRTSVGYGITDFWFAEFESEWSNDPGARFTHEAFALENRLQFVPQGTYAIDVGAFAAYEKSTRTGGADEIIFGPIFQAPVGKFLFTLNPFITAEVGKNGEKSPEFTYALQAKYLASPIFSPALEFYGEAGEIGNFDRLSEQKHAIGPVVTGQLYGAPYGLPGKLKYEIGVLFGLTPGTASQIYKGTLEYEFTF